MITAVGTFLLLLRYINLRRNYEKNHSICPVAFCRWIGLLQIEDGSGDIELNDAGSDVNINDGSGEIRLQRVLGSVTIDDGSGDIVIDGVEKDVTINEAGSGGVEIRNVKGKVKK